MTARRTNSNPHHSLQSIPSPLCPADSVLESETSSQGKDAARVAPAPTESDRGGVSLVAGPLASSSSRVMSNERRRTISLKMLSHQNSTASDAGNGRPRSQTPEPSGPQFERLDYPLTDRKYEDMLRQMPPNHERLDDISQLTEPADEGGTPSAGSSVCATGASAKKARRGTTQSEQAVVLAEEEEEALPEVCVGDDSETESVESALPEDPNDPEWVKSS